MWVISRLMKSSGDRMINISLWELTVTPGNYVYTIQLKDIMYTNVPSTRVDT